MVDAVGTTIWTYDALGRLASEKGPFTTNAVTAIYDEHGRMTGVSFGSYSVAYAIDGKGRITGISAPEGGYSFSYLQIGFKRTRVVYPNGVKETRGYDALTRTTNLVYKKWLTTLLSINYRHDGGDRRTNEVWSTGRNLDYGYDRAHQLTDVTSPSRASDRAVYRYDKAGNPVRRTEMGLGVTNSFNNLNQIVAGVWTGGPITVAGTVNYAAGTVTVAGVTGTIYADRMFDATNVTVTAGTNILTAIYHGPAFTNTQMVATDQVTVVVGNAAYTHDASGNLTGDQNFTYQYDLANRLTNVILNASNVSVFAASYDGLGRRIQVVRNGTTTERYVYLPGSFLVLAILDGSNAVKEVYTHGPDLSGTVGGAGGIGGLLAVKYPQQTISSAYYLHADALGNVVLVTDSQGKEMGQYIYTAFGRPANISGSFAPRFLYSSKEYDVETGLANFGYRHLNPRLGRWIERDRIEEVGGINLYLAVDNSPANVIDFLGLKPLWCGRLERQIRSFLTSEQDRRAWDRFVAGTKQDIILSDDEMTSIVESSTHFKRARDKRKSACDLPNNPNWFAISDKIDTSIKHPWEKSIGGVLIEFRTTCVCRCLMWSAKINDYYDFDPKWLKTHRSRLAEFQTILVRWAQVASGCGWKEFYHKGETFGTCGSGCSSSLTR